MPDESAFDGQSTSASLIRKAIEQDPEAWRQIVEAYGAMVYNQSRCLGLSADESADVAQESLLAVFLSLQRFRREHETDGFRKWVKGIVRNKARELLRKRARRVDEGAGGSCAKMQLEQVANDSDCVLASELTDSGVAPCDCHRGDPAFHLRRVLTMIEDDFKPHTWRAFWLTTVEGMPAPDVAAELEMSPAAVRKAKSRVMERIREEADRLPVH